MAREFYVNVDSILEAAELIGGTFERASALIEREMFKLIKEGINTIMEDAVRYANSEGGFPEEFQEHLLRVSSNIIPTVIMDGRDLFVSIDLEEWLGGRNELVRAFHQGAQLEGGGVVDGPYNGEPLAQPDAAERHIFWEALAKGQSSAYVFDTKTGDRHKVTIRDGASKWETTKQKYIEIWGNKAPEWLFIQFGQEEWEPYVPQYDIYDSLQTYVNEICVAELVGIFEYTVSVANAYASRGVTVIGFTKYKQPRASTGRFLSKTIQ